MIELLVDAGEWTAADDLFTARLGNGAVWKHLPAAQLGVRCGLAFVGTQARRDRCRSYLSPRRVGFHLSTVALATSNTGDFTTAEQYLRASADVDREQDDPLNLAIDLGTLSACYARLGHTQAAETTAAEALGHIEGDDKFTAHVRDCLVYLASANHIAGDTATAERRFLTADVLNLRDDPDGDHLYSARGTRWATFLGLTGRAEASWKLAEAGRRIAAEHGWNEDAARCDRLLGWLASRHDSGSPATQRLEDAVATFWGGDYVPELAETLIVLAEHHRRCGRLDEAMKTASEAVLLAGPRGMVPVHAGALCARARTRADTGSLANARDDADAALRLATVVRRLPWQELDAMETHAHADRTEGRDTGWAARAAQLRARLIPPGLDPDPLATAEARAARTDQD
jgi:tetratricopeptide (TPR) repeat protein